MQALLERFISTFIDFFNSLPLGRKFSLIAVFATVLGSMISITMWATKTNYKTLYQDLNKEDANQIAILLEEKKISYQISNNGKAISVPENMVDVWRLKLATQGVNFSGTLGYEIFDKQKFGTTSLVQRINRQRALEGELVRTIKHIKGIKRARVHLAIPKSSPFVVEKKNPEASVVLELQDGVSPTSMEIKGIAHLISYAVEGMRPEHVVILDHRGKRLSENIGDKMTAYTADRMALEQKRNIEMESKVEEILEKVVGIGKVIAKVNINLDFTESISTETQFDADNTAVLSEAKNSQKMKKEQPHGIPGSVSNLLEGNGIQIQKNKNKDSVDKEMLTKNYNVPSKVIKSKKTYSWG